MSDPRSTGGGKTAAAVALAPRASPERGVPPTEVMYVFVLPASDAMKQASDKRARHRLVWEGILGSDPAPYQSVFDGIPDAKFEGFAGRIPANASQVTYRMARSVFLKVAADAARAPDAVVLQSGEKVSPIEALAALGAVAKYRLALDTLPAPRRDLLRAQVATALEGLTREAPGDTDVIEAFWVAERIAEKIGRLDELALQTLVERDPFEPRDVIHVPYSARAALRHLSQFERTLDVLLIETERRRGTATAAATSLGEAIAALEGFDRAWAIRRRMEEVRRRNPLLVPLPEDVVRSRLETERDLGLEGVLVGSAQRELFELRRAYRSALASAGAAGPSVEQDFDRRIAGFRRTLGQALPWVAQEALADLIVRIDHARQRGQPHFEALFRALNRLAPVAVPLPETTVAELQPQLQQLTSDFPILGYRALAERALRAAHEFRKPKYRGGQWSPAARFAMTLNSELTLRWRVRALRAQKTLREEPEKAWLADQLIARVLGDAGVPEGHFVREIAAQKSAEVADDLSLLDTVLLVLSVALFFVPGGGVLGMVLRAGLLVGDAFSIEDQYQDQLAAETLAGVGLASDAPSGWWLVLSVLSFGLDLSDAARLLRVQPGQLRRAIEEDDLDALLRQARDHRRDLVKSYLRQQRAELTERYFTAQAKAVGALGVGPAFLEGSLHEAARLMVRIGYKRLEEFIVDVRVLTGADVPAATLRKAFARARNELAEPPDGFRIDELQQAVRDHGRLKAQADELAGAMDDRVKAIEKAVDLGDDAALRSAERSHRKLAARHRAVVRRLERSQRLLAVIDGRIAQLERQAAELVTTLNQATRREVDRRYQVVLLLEKREQIIRERLVTLRRVKRGEALSVSQRHRLHEDVVSSFLREQPFHRVGDQTALQVFYKNGTSDTVIVDNLVEVTAGRFRIYDAKWSDSFDADIGSGRRALTTPAQRRAYLAISEGRVERVELVDSKSARPFGLTSGTAIALEPRVLLVLNQRDGRLRVKLLQ